MKQRAFLSGSENTLYNTIKMGTCHYIYFSKPIERTAPRESFWVIEICQCRCFHHNVCIIWMRDVGNGEAMYV